MERSRVSTIRRSCHENDSKRTTPQDSGQTRDHGQGADRRQGRHGHDAEIEEIPWILEEIRDPRRVSQDAKGDLDDEDRQDRALQRVDHVAVVSLDVRVRLHTEQHSVADDQGDDEGLEARVLHDLAAPSAHDLLVAMEQLTARHAANAAVVCQDCVVRVMQVIVY
jgi:hypothetical protein